MLRLNPQDRKAKTASAAAPPLPIMATGSGLFCGQLAGIRAGQEKAGAVPDQVPEAADLDRPLMLKATHLWNLVLLSFADKERQDYRDYGDN